MVPTTIGIAVASASKMPARIRVMLAIGLGLLVLLVLLNYQDYTKTVSVRSLEMPQENSKHLWQGLDPVEVRKVWPGLVLDGDYMLREFIDPKDPRAHGMAKEPKTIEDMSDDDVEERFFQLVTVNDLHCADMKRMGNRGNGGWDACVSGPYQPQQGCIVYSFGINNDFSFDDAMGEVYGCQVKSFDPSMKKGDHKRSDHVYFYKIGLGGSDTINDQGWKLMTLESIFKANGHSNKTIDYLKLDIEYSEWDSLEHAFERMSLKNVKQFAFEIHLARKISEYPSKFDLYRFYNVLLGLEKHGFRQYHVHLNPRGRVISKLTGKERSIAYEIYYININFLKDS